MEGHHKHIRKLCLFKRRQGQIISLTGLSALSIVLWKPNVIVSSLALDFEREENRKFISM